MSPAAARRTQLTLFVSGPSAAQLENVRQQVDPVQFSLIAAHVTLCREHELDGITVEELRRRIERAAPKPLALVFGVPIQFGGHGVLLPCIEGAAAFRQLRAIVLRRQSEDVHEAHITLAHPRNPLAPGNVAGAYAALPPRLEVMFETVSLITQRDGQPWVVAATIPLRGGLGAD